ncbi:hypothetical protein FH609_002410 [Streptomyces sp. 3MP-14]|uniref:Uncharacterized protein n=1 Tax=Streptomyces mimosae TaxID=2586635 RepID=A0A5N6APM2_9ACTN|nr:MULTISPECIES: protein DpdD [Streptomyces]KAB8170797.1 hypothetical protein FH607_000060 [Streptomyces mimosae]KAB8179850.1 hypothetical protein FH609_002410 [Streptomyces sp. 3MP-14]
MTHHPELRPENRRKGVEDFLQRFFGQGNRAWPSMDPAFPHQDRTRPFVDALRRGDDAPVVLPRLYADRGPFVVYVIARDIHDRAKTVELIRAFAGPTYIQYELGGGIQPVPLDPGDSVERAVLDFFGSRPVFRLGTGQVHDRRRKLVDALLLMQSTVASRPPRLWRVAKPVGRLLAEFDASLAAGADAASRTILDHLEACGGVTALNLAALRIKRLDRLGRSEELLRFRNLADVIRHDPPVPAKEAILNAIYAALEEPLAENDLPAARQRLEEHGRFVPDLLDVEAALLGAPAITVLLLAASVLEELPLLRRLADTVRREKRVADVPRLVWDHIVRDLGEGEDTASVPTDPGALSPAGASDGSAVAPVTVAIDSWQTLFAEVAAGGGVGQGTLANGEWAAWASPAVDDAVLAEFLDGLGNEAADRVWQLVGAFIEAVGYNEPAGLTAHAFIRSAVAFDRFGPGDLAALQALMEIALRAAPAAQTYVEILEEISAERSRWVSPERAPVALDFVDRLVLAACPDSDARGTFAFGLLEPLWVHQTRLSESDLAFARRLANEVGIDFDWQDRVGLVGEREVTLADLPSLNLLLYSLDEAVLGRCAEEIERLAPAVKVVTASDHVGSSQLRHKARSADVIVMATRCAKHAATGCIDQNRRTEHVGYANGSGSASLLRAAVDKLRVAAST